MTSPYVFLSHASDDKPRLKSLVEALALLGLTVWVDRPGPGANNLGLDVEFAERHSIQGLRTGADWSTQIAEAIREAGAVLVCFSRAFDSSRHVLAQELLLGQHHHKLVACIVDDLRFEELPQDLG